jgi:epoxide hydrolase-like predicted phosphatase
MGPAEPAIDPGERAIDAAIFDLGGVVMRNGGPGDIQRRFPDLDPAVLLPILMGPYHEDTDHPWHRLERGEITLVEVRDANRAALEAAGVTGPFAPGPPITFEPNDDMLVLIRDLRAAGLRTGLLTNNARELRALWWDLLPYDELFDDIVDSSEVGLRKPNPAIYRLALDRLGASAHRTAFLDDIVSNVDAAERVGLQAVLVEPGGLEAIATVRDLAGVS